MRSHFDDPRHRRAEDIGARAAAAHDRGDYGEARKLYAEAAPLEEAAAREASREHPQERGGLAVSAAAMWYKAGCLHEAVALAEQFFAEEELDPRDRAELRKIADYCRTQTLRLDARGPSPGPAPARPPGVHYAFEVEGLEDGLCQVALLALREERSLQNAAKRLGVSRHALRRMLQKFGIDWREESTRDADDEGGT